ncbi:uncharacterized protein [Euwallacea similis]|uniref:uncharacterized protein n=1 Tax=Euwallacea similis TaxID=1736056 RepID=UPI003450B17B
MKKYQRLVLLLISVVSVALFLIYRQQYNRLRHVLEVFNFFGTPCNLTELEKSDSLILEHDWGPPPVWQEIDSKSYIFSAFLIEQNLVKGIGVRHASAAAPKLCYLLFEDEGRPVKGQFVVLKIENNSGYTFYLYSCSFIANNREAFAVSFRASNRSKDVSVMLVNTVQVKPTFNSTMCVLPSDFTKKSLFEFLSFHSLLSVESFIIYHEENLLYSAIKLIKNLSNTLNMWATFYSYNVPFKMPLNIAYQVIGYDCHFRTKAQTRYSLALKVNDYVVPSLDEVQTQTMRLPIKKFCLNHVNQKRPIVLQNFEAVTDYSFNAVLRVSKFNVSKTMRKKIPSLFENTCVVHRYEKCHNNVNTHLDYSMKRFSTDLTRSTLVQSFIHDSS